MTFERAMAYKLPCGKTTGEATREDWEADAKRLDELAEAVRNGYPPERIQAIGDQQREFQEAMAVVDAEFVRRGILRKDSRGRLNVVK
jgi:uncharacterized membrane protein YqiK